MAKSKRKANLANSTAEKKNKTTKTNPFEIRFSREKHSVLNRKKKSWSKSKNEAVGRPGIARSRAIQKRKETLLQEFKIRNKNNVFIDKRIGEKDAELSAEDKMIARFTMERMKNTGKKSIFNLGEEENLTHFGQSISEIEQYDDDPRSDDEDSSKKMNTDMNFGGFLTQNDVEFSSGKSNSRKEWIEQMIADSKQRKFELQKEQEEALKATKAVDQQWKDIYCGLKVTESVYKKKFFHDPYSDDEADDSYGYNKLMKELNYEPKKVKAQDRLKTDEEIIKDQKETLEKLEELRQKRMKMDDGDEQEESEEENTEENGDEDSEKEDENDEESDKDEYSDLEESEDEEKVPEKVKKSKKSTENLSEKKEIPFTFKVPQTSEGLDELLENHNSKEKSLIIERMIKCNHPQFGNDNKFQMENLFTFLLQHIHECLEDAEDLKSAEILVPFLFDLAKFSPQKSGEALRSVLEEKYEEYCKNPRNYPDLASLIFLKISALIFPTSDYRHPVSTPCMQWMSQMLASCKVFTKTNLARGILVATLLVENISLSKKFIPELMNFLTGIVFMAVPKDETTVIPFVPPFKVVGAESTLLADLLKKKVKPKKFSFKDCVSSEEEINEEFAASALKVALDLLEILADFWKNMPSAPEIFARLHKEFLPLLPEKTLHKEIVEKVTKLSKEIGEKCQFSESRSHKVPQRKKEIKMLKLYDPELDDNFDPFVKKRNLSKEKQEMAKLNHKLKREKKGAKKDLRADAAFLAKQKAKERREKDADRMKKTKAILAGLGGQEGEYRQMQRQKSKKK